MKIQNKDKATFTTQKNKNKIVRYLFPFLMACGIAGNGYAQGEQPAPAIPSSGTSSGFYTQSFSDLLGTGNTFLSNSDVASLMNPKAEIIGSRYFLNKWMKGSVIASNGVVVSNDSLLFYYDKISHNLLFTVDKKKIMEADNSHIRYFILNDGDVQHEFKRVPLINPELFYELLAEDSAKYSLYKLTTTRFIKANYRTNGMYESGNRNDQFKDEFQYYIVFPGNKTYQPVFLKKKSLKKVFGKNNSGMNTYFSQHENEDTDEGYLKNLVIYLNQETVK